MANKHPQSHTASLTEPLAPKPFLKIGEVAKLTGVKPHVLRYWETEFPSLKPKKNPSGQRIYAKIDIETIVEIKNLLYNERYTISGAKLMLARQEGTSKVVLPESAMSYGACLIDVKKQIHELLELLQKPLAF